MCAAEISKDIQEQEPVGKEREASILSEVRPFAFLERLSTVLLLPLLFSAIFSIVSNLLC